MANLIEVIPDFPSKGIYFRHIGPLLADAQAFEDCMKKLLHLLAGVDFDIVAGLDARGFIMATAVQMLTKKPQVMIRKESKLPNEVYSAKYSMEYGNPKVVQLEKSAVRPGQRVLIVDDLLATGGTLGAAMDLVHQAGGKVAAIACVIGLDGLNGAEKLRALDQNVIVKTLFNFPCDNGSPVARMDAEIQEYRPTRLVRPQEPTSPVLMWHPNLETMAQRLLSCSNYRPSYVTWGNFPDTWCNITFEPSQTLQNHDVTFLFSLATKDVFLEQLSLLVALPRQQIRSLTVVIPWVGPATHERVEYSGMLATVEPVMKILSNSIPQTKSGLPVIRMFDLHALPIRFYPSDNIVMKLMTAIPLLKAQLKPRQTIAFPDEGAYKRFRTYFDDFPVVICGKLRGSGEERTITIQNRLHWPNDPELEQECFESVVIVDDLVQSGGTLITCAAALKKEGFKSVSAYVTHAVFPNETWKKFTQSSEISTFYLTDTNPLVTNKLEGMKPFHVLQVEELLASEISKDVPSVTAFPVHTEFHPVYVASTNEQKLEAVTKVFGLTHRVFGVKGTPSNVPEQPVTKEQTELGAHNRLQALKKLNLDSEAVLIAIENGIEKDGDVYKDIVVVVCSLQSQPDKDFVFYGEEVLIPEKCYGFVKKAIEERKQEVTFGSLVEKAYGFQNWHQQLTSMTRVQQIVPALKQVLDILKS